MRFTNREEAGRKLGAELMQFADKSPVVLALPRGGVPVGCAIAKALQAPLDLVFVKKIGDPLQPELAIAAVVNGEHSEIIFNEDVMSIRHPPQAYIESETQLALEEIERRKRIYLADRKRVPLQDQTVILVDDGIATGSTIRAAIHALRRHGPARIILAAPVAAAQTLDRLGGEADEVVCLFIPQLLRSIGAHYDDFHQVSDQEVVDDLRQIDKELVD